MARKSIRERMKEMEQLRKEQAMKTYEVLEKNDIYDEKELQTFLKRKKTEQDSTVSDDVIEVLNGYNLADNATRLEQIIAQHAGYEDGFKDIIHSLVMAGYGTDNDYKTIKDVVKSVQKLCELYTKDNGDNK